MKKKKQNKYLLASALSLLVLGSSFKAGAESLESKVNDLDQQQKIIQRKWELEQERLKDSAIAVAGKDGFAIQSGDKSFQLKLKGLLHADGRFFVKVPESNGNHTFVARRVRPILEGTIYKNFDFRFVPDFGNGTTAIQDAYADAKVTPYFKLRVGKFKVPVGLERLQTINYLNSVEFAFPTSLVPNRDVGAQVFGDIQDGVLSYAVGAFNGVADGSSGDTDVSDAKDIAGRLFAQPFLKTDIDSLKGLGVGIGASYGKQKAASPLPSFRSSGQKAFFQYTSGATPTTANGKIVRFSPQAYYYYGPFGLLGEYVQSRQNVLNGTSEATLNNQAWQVNTSYFLTGEKASYKGIKVKNPLKPSDGKWGAVELVARYNELRVDQAAFSGFASATAWAQRARAFAGGINWHFNDNVKWVTDYENTTFLGGATSGNRPSNMWLNQDFNLHSKTKL
ncbi:MAG: porin [Deltaproteobacteria bacterium]|nr:MAG: porin [Deltaproteobacteria bacterium]